MPDTVPGAPHRSPRAILPGHHTASIKTTVPRWGTWVSERPGNLTSITQLLGGLPVYPQVDYLTLTTTSRWLEGWRCDLREDFEGRSLLDREEESASLRQRWCRLGSGSGASQWNTDDTFLQEVCEPWKNGYLAHSRGEAHSHTFPALQSWCNCTLLSTDRGLPAFAHSWCLWESIMHPARDRQSTQTF